MKIIDLRQHEVFDSETGKLNVNAFRTNTVLRKDEWKELDERVVEVARMRLNGIQDLRAAGLVLPLGGLGTTITEYEKMSFMEDAEVTMDLEAQVDEDRVEYTLISLPVPVFQKNFRLSLRVMEASRRLGRSLDTSMAEVAARLVIEQAESALFGGVSTINVNNQAVLGYTTETNRNTGSSSDWGTVGNIQTAALAMVAAAEADNYFGPYIMYAAKTQYGQTRINISTDNEKTAMGRMLDAIPTITALKPADRLTDGVIVLVQMTRDVVDMAVGADIQTIEWNPTPFTAMFKVFMAYTPRPKSNEDGGSGIVHYTGA